MPTNADSRAKLQASFQELTSSAEALNTASDALGAAISKLNLALKKLNIGVNAWVTFDRENDEVCPQYSTEWRLGYAKLEGGRGLALRVVQVDDSEPSERIGEEWLLGDAPRELRLKALEHVPELIEELTKETAKTAKRVRVKADQATELAGAIESIADERVGGRQ